MTRHCEATPVVAQGVIGLGSNGTGRAEDTSKSMTWWQLAFEFAGQRGRCQTASGSPQPDTEGIMAVAKRASARAKLSAGILAYRRVRYGPEVLLVHPGGPYWRKKDDGAWSIPKGEIEAPEDPEQAARREFAEELGPAASVGPLRALGEIRERG